MKKNAISKKTVLSTLLALAILCCSTVSFFAISSYDIYMSQERPLIKTSPVEYNSDWVEEPVLMFDGILEYYQQRFDCPISNGSVYQVRIVNGSEELVCLASGNYVDCSSDGNYMYLASGGIVTRWNLTTLESTVIYSGEDNVVSVWGTEDIVFFQVGNSVYHYYVPAQTLALSIATDALNAWRPESNRVLRVVENNSDYVAALSASGAARDQKLEDPVAFTEWLYENLDIQTSSDSNIMQECDVSNILTALGVNETFGYFYDVVSQGVLNEYNVMEDLAEITTEIVDFGNSASTMVAVTPTIWSYPTNTYFSKNRLTGCNCHGDSASCDTSWHGGCDCRLYDSAIQCNAYARYVYTQTSGYSSRINGQYVVLSGLPSPGGSESVLRAFFTTKNMPIIVESTTVDYSGHTFLIYAATETGIYICEANTSQPPKPAGMTNFNCRVYNERYIPYSDLDEWYISFSSMIAAPQTHTHTPFYDILDDTHTLICSTCNISVAAPEAHYYDEDGYCVCGYSQFWRKLNDEDFEIQ